MPSVKLIEERRQEVKERAPRVVLIAVCPSHQR